MKNADFVLETLSRVPQEGAVVDQEPMPIGRVVKADRIDGLRIVGHTMTIEIEHRMTGDTESHEILVVALEYGGRTIPFLRLGADELQEIIEV